MFNSWPLCDVEHKYVQLGHCRYVKWQCDLCTIELFLCLWPFPGGKVNVPHPSFTGIWTCYIRFKASVESHNLNMPMTGAVIDLNLKLITLPIYSCNGDLYFILD